MPCQNPECVEGKVVRALAGRGVMTVDCPSCFGFARANPPRGAKRRRRNPPRAVEVRQFGSKRGHLVGSDVFALEYRNVGSAQRSPYRHDFDSRGIELWALADGSLLIRHPKFRLWDDFVVEDNE